MILSLLSLLACSSPPATPADSATATDSSPAPPCTTFDDAEAVATVADASLEEISGIVASRLTDGVLWVLEDSGGPAVLTALREDGTVRASLRLEGTNNLDWEDLAAGPCPQGTCLYVADIGDNAKARVNVRLLRVPEPELADVPEGAEVSVAPERFTLQYPDGAHDAEALVVTPAQGVWIISKAEAPWRYGLSALPAAPPPEDKALTLVAMDAVDTVPEGASPGLATLPTGADLSADGRLLVVRTYSQLWSFRVETAGALSAGVSFLGGPELQGEAVALSVDGRTLWHVGEQVQPPLYRLSCDDGRR